MSRTRSIFRRGLPRLATVAGLLLLTLLYLYLRSHAPVGRHLLFPVAAGAVGFVFHALLFFSGAFLVLQLATIAGVVGLCLFQPLRPQRQEQL